MTTPKAYPQNPQLTRLCLLAHSNDNDTFPLSIPFENGKAAQSFRCEFYAYRRALHANASNAYLPEQILERDGADLLEIARVDYVNTPSILTIRLRTQRPAFKTAYNALDELLGPLTSNEVNEEQLTDCLPELGTAYEEPAALIDRQITTDEGIWYFKADPQSPRSDAAYLILLKRGQLEGTFEPIANS